MMDAQILEALERLIDRVEHIERILARLDAPPKSRRDIYDEIMRRIGEPPDLTNHCRTCGIDQSRPMGYVCTHTACPTRIVSTC